MTEDKFRQAEREYFILRGKFEAGRITREQFQAALKDSMIRDEAGRYWVIFPIDDKWRVHENGEWVEAEPPTFEDERARLPEQPRRSSVEDERARLPQPPMPPSLTSRRKSPITFLAIAGAFVILIICAGAILFLVQQSSVPNVAKSNLAVVATSEPQKLLAPQEFATTSQNLANRIADLNRAELKFIRDAKASASIRDGRLPGLALPFFAPDILDDDLLDIAARASQTAQLANDLGRTAVAQDGGSENAGKIADPYFSIARFGYALVIDAQNIRDGLKTGNVTRAESINTIAEYGARLWNPIVTDAAVKGNPFLPNVKDPASIPAAKFLTGDSVRALKTQMGASNNIQTWLAATNETVEKTINVPAPRVALANSLDPNLVRTITTTQGQSDADRARQIAAANLAVMSGTPFTGAPPAQLPIKLFKSASIAGSESLAANTFPTFDRGNASAAAKTISLIGATEETVNNVFTINGNDAKAVAQIPVREDKPIVALTISNLVIKQINKRPKDTSSTFEADVLYELDVQWQANLAAPQFILGCIGGNYFDISTVAGRQHVDVKGLLIQYPGAENVFCYASHAGNTLGLTSISFLVGDADGATKRAIQGETASAILDATLTADAVGTARAEQTQAAATAQARGTSAAATAQYIATSNAVATQVYGTQTAEFRLTANAFATERARPPTETTIPSRTPTFTPKLAESFGMRGDTFSVSGKVVLTPRRLWRICISGTAFLINPDRAVGPEILHVNGISVPRSGCIVVEGTGAVVVITCTQGLQPAKDPGGYQITVEDLGPS